MRRFLSQALLLTIGFASALPSIAMDMSDQRRSTNIVDCRAGWYCINGYGIVCSINGVGWC